MTRTPPSKKVNRLDLPMTAYKGVPSTLCKGCGHDAITSQIVKAFWESGVKPHQVAKMSGIGCSSKTPAYFLGSSHGFNAVHGRMPSVATGAVLGNRTLVTIGVSGDGDTASIGLGQFCHLLRRNVPMVYIIENNGVYGLTKGQFSATADKGATLKTGAINELPAIDCCSLAIEMGCSYVARSFSGDPKQLVPLIQGAISHEGTAVIDVVSPCVTFNNREDSTKSYPWAKEHEELLHQIDFVPHFEPLEEIDYEEGEVRDVELADGSLIRLRKLERGHDPTNRQSAMRLLHETYGKGELLTGLVYVDPQADTFFDLLELAERPLAQMGEKELRPGPEVLEEVMKSLM
ncbi:MAG TPA: 2-oxoacid:ferredoxin oxidoreductase subunit beta [Acidobacteriota bacterium]|nr:2-oxoacid:ferredoxin oxidoreductase subunit beta [Acidobacteriota bacterium]